MEIHTCGPIFSQHTQGFCLVQEWEAGFTGSPFKVKFTHRTEWSRGGLKERPVSDRPLGPGLSALRSPDASLGRHMAAHRNHGKLVLVLHFTFQGHVLLTVSPAERCETHLWTSGWF